MPQFIITDSVRWKSRTVVELCDDSTLCYVKYDDDSCAERRRKSLDLLRNDNESEEQKNCILRQYFVVNTEYTFIVSPCIFIYLLVFTNVCTFIVIKILHKQSLM